MFCEILRTLYLKSNGEVLCNDDFGERIVLGEVSSDPAWNIGGLFSNTQYQRIRSAFLAGEAPWKGVCERCAFLRSNERYRDDLGARHIVKLQIEPSLVCNLSCPCCSNSLQMRERKKPFIMPPELFRRLLCSLGEEGFIIEHVEYCGQGEPLMHPQFGQFVQSCRELFPDTKQRLITNGNFDYAEKLGGHFIDEIYVSCDGARQRSYERYRVKGNVSTALRFLGDAPSTASGSKQLLVWKYILFEFNDSEEEIFDAQQLAEEYGVDILLFVLTHSQYRSQRFTLETIGSLPVRFANVRTNAHPSFYNGALFGRYVNNRSWTAKLRTRTYNAHLEDVFLFSGNVLHLKGWAAGRQGVDIVRISCNGTPIGEVVPAERRPDVFSVFPRYKPDTAGFRLSAVLPGKQPSALDFTLQLLRNEREVGGVTQTFAFE
jgi:wyosine [tRNA(Phe)-imidazoG37] synthetase (radical SAM superfamily)